MLTPILVLILHSSLELKSLGDLQSLDVFSELCLDGVLFIYFLKFYLFLNLFLAALGLRCCTRAFSSCGEQGLLFVAMGGPLIVVASLVAEHGL